MNVVNHQFRLAARPVGMPGTSNWSLTEEPLEDPREGEFIVKVLYISLDPAMRGWMNEGKLVHRPREDRRGYACPGGRQGCRVQEPRLRSRRPCHRGVRRAGICCLERARGS